MNDRIKLAEAMGWERTKYDRWLSPDRKMRCEEPPDPFTDANDCEALIEFLNSKGWQVEVHWQFTDDESLAAGAYVHIWNRFSEVHERSDIDVDRWKECVCKLALKALK